MVESRLTLRGLEKEKVLEQSFEGIDMNQKYYFLSFLNPLGPIDPCSAVNKGETVDRFYYIDNCLKPVVKAIKKQRPKTGLKNMKLLHDNARAHDNQDVLYYLNEERFNLLPHPPYSPDLSPCDFWFNDYIKRNLGDQNE